MKHRYPLVATLILLLSACSQKAIIQFSQKAPELRSADALTEIMLVTKSPRIVLRVPSTRKGVTDTQGPGSSKISRSVATTNSRQSGLFTLVNQVEPVYDEAALYNAIEKTLFKEGFSVRDRGLFNQVLDSNHSIDYSKIKELTDTDLILELVSLESGVGYLTNVCQTYPAGEQKNIREYRIDKGASIEFKLVHVKTNQIVGSYKIHYTPCLYGCRGIYSKLGSSGTFTNQLWLKPGEQEQIQRLSRQPYERLDQNDLEVFIADATKQLVQSMRDSNRQP